LYEDCANWIFAGKADYRRCIPRSGYGPHDGKANAQFHKDVRSISIALRNNLRGIDIVLAHDLLYLPALLPYNLAVRKTAETLKQVRWLHWSHSRPKTPQNARKGYPYNMLYKDMPRSKFVSVTKEQAKGYTRMYGIPLSRVVIVHNPRATRDFMRLDPVVEKISEEYKLFEADIVSVMPTVLSRMYKQQEMCLYIMASLKNAGKNVRFIFANAYAVSNREDEEIRLLQLRWLSRKLGLTDDEVIFTSETSNKLKNGCPSKVIRDLLHISNVYLQPSVSETGCLALAEAGLTKNLCVLNKNLASLKEFVRDNALWLDFDFLIPDIKKRYKVKDLQKGGAYKYFYKYFQDNRARFALYAEQIIKTLGKDKTLSFFTSAKKELNEQVVFEEQLKPLLEE